MKRPAPKAPFSISSTPAARVFSIPVIFSTHVTVQAASEEEAQALASVVVGNMRRRMDRAMVVGCTCGCKPFTQHDVTCLAYPTRRLS